MDSSNQNGAINAGTSKRPTLLRSLTGGLLQPRFHILTNGYPAHKEHVDEAVCITPIKPESVVTDLKGMCHWSNQLDPKPDIRRYWDQGSHTANNKAVRRVLKDIRAQPTLIYLAGHTEKKDDQLAYTPADYLSANSPDQPQLIPYDTMRPWLLNDQHLAPLVFITEVCFCENFLKLPYVLQYEGNEARWVPTGHPEVSTGKSREIAFYNTKLSETRSLKDIAKKLQENVNAILSSDSAGRSQHPKVYSSRVMDEPHFFATLGFCPPNSVIETDSDSSG
ncbi:unnamed protein product [Rhizoctonia solani]|uniref:Uncharacterized protein n=1 Tax=Rhizoctonia solani TaxID=456999 RepID=A0A8H3HPJ9_9AGAM|nr:unnamed protein product [Rhizoctonia solani]